jgi:hypothetical protein
MRKLLLAFAVINWFAVSAQTGDSVSATKVLPNDAGGEPVSNSTFNYTSTTINNLFNDNIRPGASNRIMVDFDYGANSSNAPMGFAYALLFRHEVTPAMKDRIDHNIKSQLKFEDNMKTGWSIRHYFKKWDGEVFFSYNHRQLRNVVASKGTFELLFYGNARFAGQTVDISNLLVQNFIYNQYSGGIKKKIDYGKYQMDIGVGISLLQVINQQDIRVNTGSIYTSEDGDTIRVNYDLSFNTAREGANTFFQRNGLGCSGDFHLGFMDKNNWKLSIDVSDVGYMYFRKTPVNYSAAKNIEFRGIVIPDLLHFGPATFDTLNLDSAVRSYLPTKTANQYSLFSPFSASIAFSKSLLHEKLVLTFGLQYRHLPKYYAYGYVKANYFIKPDMVFSVTGGGGGYSWFNLGLEFAKRWKYFDFALGTPNLLGTVIPSHYTGMGLYLRMATSF